MTPRLVFAIAAGSHVYFHVCLHRSLNRYLDMGLSGTNVCCIYLQVIYG